LDLVIGYTVVSLKVAFGLGFVIFVHELGHFAVAKMCGVKCEKFYLGFDIAGLKFCKFRWGETEYGIGILPLGGYVKMLGQEDNPAKLREEMERAKASGGNDGPKSAASGESQAVVSGQQPPVPAVSTDSLFDPRSFLAKSVPKRMAIISAGVIMNLIFAFLMAVVAFGMGAPEPPCTVGEVHAGEAAWQAGLRSGDEILEIGGKPMKKFRDLQMAITLGSVDAKNGVPFLIRRDGKEMTVTVKPQNSLGIFAIGVSGQNTTKLLSNQTTWLVPRRHCVIPGSTADRAKAFSNGDQIVRIDNVPITDYAQINTELAKKADKKIVVAVDRAEVNAKGKPTGVIKRIEVPIEPDPMRDLGLIMTMGPITAIQADSPAAAAGIKVGDRIIQPDGDPMTLPERLAKEAGKTIELKLERENGKEPVVVSVQLRQPTEIVPSVFRNSPVAIPALGVAFRVYNEVAKVVEGSPADKAGMKPGDVLVQAKFIPPDAKTLQELGVKSTEDLAGGGSMPFGKNDNNWPSFINVLQTTLPGTTVELTYKRGAKDMTSQPIAIVAVPNIYDAERGLRFEPMMTISRADSLGEMLTLGGIRTLDDVTYVFHSVRALGTGQVPLRGLAGPWMIIKIALQAADRGTVELLLFLTFLSANLAVINFMPIPVLDGGHFVLLAYEGIRGKPANEHVQTVLAYIGLALILTLMVWVFGLDLGFIARH
jgi:regulator of sigma E protease